MMMTKLKKKVRTLCEYRSLARRVLLMLLAFTGGVAASFSTAQTLVWSDEFSGGLGNWNIQTGDGTDYGLPAGWGNNELQWYQGQNVTTSGGKLVITAKKEQVNGYEYTSGRINTKGRFDFMYGRVETRVKFPPGKGLWAAVWMLPTDNVYGTWAASGEIDIAETVNLGVRGPDKLHGTIHYGGEWPNNTSSGCSTGISNATTGFNEIALEWEPAEMRWYLNGQLYCTQNNWYSSGGAFPAPFDQNFHFLINLAVGGNWPGAPDSSTVFPAYLEVDYVRVYDMGSGSGGTATEMLVSSVQTGTEGAGKGAKYGKASVTVVDDLGTPVEGATVSGQFSGTFNETASGVTGADGVATILTSSTASGGVTVNYCVTSVTGTSLTFNSSASQGMCP